MSYDPKPRRRSHRGHRKGIEPAGLKRWRLAHRRLADPRRHRHRRTRDPSASLGRRKHIYSGRRGGRSFMAGLGTRMRRRYDPARSRRRYGRLRSYGGKVERGLSSKWGWLLGGALAATAGILQGMNDTAKMIGSPLFTSTTAKVYGQQIYGGNYYATGAPIAPEISNLWKPSGIFTSTTGWLKYKLTQSAWAVPFWLSLAGLIGSILPLGSKTKRIQRPLKAVSAGALIASTIGVLALPGTTLKDVVSSTTRQTSTDVTPNINASTEASKAAMAYLASGNQATGGTRRYLIAV